MASWDHEDLKDPKYKLEEKAKLAFAQQEKIAEKYDIVNNIKDSDYIQCND